MLLLRIRSVRVYAYYLRHFRLPPSDFEADVR